MNFLKVFVESPLAGAIGWTLLHSLWEGAIVCGVLAVVLLATRSARIRYAAACAAMLVIVSGFVFTLATVVSEVPQSPSMRQSLMARAPLDPVPPRSAADLLTSTVSANSDFASSNHSLAPLVPWLTPFWITGVSLVYLRWIQSCISVQRLRRRGVCTPPEHWQERLAQLGERLHLARPVQLLESSLAEVPTVLGHFRPLILFPAGLLAGLSPGQVELILLHELAHIRRHDYLLNIFQRLAEGVFFYHPAVWWISRVMRVERENCCDDLAVSITGDSHQYASALAALEQRRQAVLEPGLAATGGNLVKRIRRVLTPRQPVAPWVPLVAAAMFVIAAAISVAAWQSQPRQDTGYPTQLRNEGAAVGPNTPLPPSPPVRAQVSASQDEQTPDTNHVQRVRVSEGVMETLVVEKVPPVYPEVARKAHIQGIVVLQAVIDTDGSVENLHVISGPPMLGEAAIDAVRQWRYKPYFLNGSPVEVETVVRVLFGDKAAGTTSRTTGEVGSESRVQVPKGVIVVPEGVMVVLKKVPPVYPEVAQQARIQGTVVLQAMIGIDGSVEKLHLVSGHPMLAQAAIDAVKQWRYKPHLLNGSPARVSTEVRIPFSLAPTSENIFGYYGKAEVTTVNGHYGKEAVVVYYPRSNWADVAPSRFSFLPNSNNSDPRVFVVQLLHNTSMPGQWSGNARLFLNRKTLALVRENGTNVLFTVDKEIPPSLKQFKFETYSLVGIGTYFGMFDAATIQDFKTYGTPPWPTAVSVRYSLRRLISLLSGGTIYR